MSNGLSFDETFRRVAFSVEHILKGIEPGELPMEQPTQFYRFLNQKAARAIWIKISESILLHADKRDRLTSKELPALQFLPITKPVN
jgi:putative ABC transport system substrate-binding protein